MTEDGDLNFLDLPDDLNDALMEFTEHIADIWDDPNFNGMPARHIQVKLKQYLQRIER